MFRYMCTVWNDDIELIGTQASFCEIAMQSLMVATVYKILDPQKERRCSS